MLDRENPLQRVWGMGHAGHLGPIRTAVKNTRRKLADDADNPTDIFNKPRVGYRMPKVEGQDEVGES